ncbi:hypothetical protein [Archangium sp.]|uniref:hypothetical protein n=1 Tax=Archangium sp. TaxID=1872627 RepID=UPI0038998D6E
MSYVLARGERLSLFGIILLTMLLGLAGAIACCVGIFPAHALGQFLIGGFYLSLRQGSELDVRPRGVPGI